MTVEVRRLDPQAVEAAEFARKNNRIIMAAELAAIGLGLTSLPLGAEEIAEISRNPEQRAILACLARIQVDSLKTIANQTRFPHHALPALESAARTIRTIYGDQILGAALKDVNTDHLGRPHHFWVEMKRDEAKTLFASSVLYSFSESELLTLWGESILQGTYDVLPDGHPTKPLIGIELQLSRASRGKMPNIAILGSDFETLCKADEESNPHRVATVASWMIIWGEKLCDIYTNKMGQRVFSRIIAKHPEWAFMTENEREKMAKQQMRKALFRLLTPITTSPQRRQSLFSFLKR